MRKRVISVSAMEKILRLEGAKRVSKKAAMLMGERVEEFAGEIGRRAVRNALMEGRKVVKREDIEG